MSKDDHTKLVELLKQFSTAMLVTHEADDRLRARPMAIAQVEDDGKIWFLSEEHTAKVHEIIRDTRVHLTLQKDRSIYLSINGRATLVHDRSKVDEIWQESFKVWFPDGKDDPDLVLISVEPEDAEYWDNQGWKKVKYLFQAAKAYLTHTTPETDDEKHGMLQL
jgi:general stress protein 26